MTNKPMLSVEREVIEKALRDALTIRFDTDSHVTKLRALLDAQHAVCSNGILCQNSKCSECGGNGAYKPAAWERDIDYRPEELGSPETEPAAQHQGEPVALQHMAVSEGGVLRWMTGRKMQDCELYAMPDGSAIRSKLYAEQPAPVVVVMPDRKEDPGPVAGLTRKWAEGWNDALAEVARLNGVKP